MKSALRPLFFLLLLSLACNTLAPPPTLPPAPTAAGTLPPAGTETREAVRPAGGSRADPVPYGETASTLDLDFRVREVLLGEAAWQALQEANQFNEPPPRGMQWLLLRLEVVNQSNRSLELTQGDFLVTGLRGIAYFSGAAVTPKPKFRFTLSPGERADGWLDYLAALDDGNLLVFSSPADAPPVFAALSPGARVTQVAPMVDVPPLSTLGRSPDAPAPPGEAVEGDGWRLWVVDALWGDAAWRAVQQAEPYNDPPLAGYEYLAVYLGIASQREEERYRYFFSNALTCQGPDGVYEPAAVAPPFPPLNEARLFPQAAFRGWEVFLVPQGKRCTLVYQPFFSLDENDERYLALP